MEAFEPDFDLSDLLLKSYYDRAIEAQVDTDSEIITRYLRQIAKDGIDPEATKLAYRKYLLSYRVLDEHIVQGYGPRYSISKKGIKVHSNGGFHNYVKQRNSEIELQKIRDNEVHKATLQSSRSSILSAASAVIALILAGYQLFQNNKLEDKLNQMQTEITELKTKSPNLKAVFFNSDSIKIQGKNN